MIYHADCIDILRTLPDGSIDMILQDPPYNMTACKWECELDLPILWTEWERVIKDNGAIVMTGNQPFTTDLINSKRSWFRYNWIWIKNKCANFQNAQYQPLRKSEDVLVFSKVSMNKMIYNPQMEDAKLSTLKRNLAGRKTVQIKENRIKHLAEYKEKENKNPYVSYPDNILDFQSVHIGGHPTQKPVDLFRYLIRTYTNEGETVFDGYAGSGTTAIACHLENRKYICCEKEAEYIEIIHKRIDEATRQLCLYS